VNKARLKYHAIQTGAHITHAIATLAASLAVYRLVGQPTLLGILAVITTALIVNDVLGTLFTEALEKPLTRLDAAASAAKGDEQ